MNTSKVNQAVECFNQGFNCSQAILSTYGGQFGLDTELALKIASGLGAGMGRMCETCGAVSGAYLVIGLKFGNNSPNDTEGKEQTYAMVQEFDRRFKERNHTTVCEEILGVNLITGDKAKAATQVKRLCPKMVRDAAEILELLL